MYCEQPTSVTREQLQQALQAVLPSIPSGGTGSFMVPIEHPRLVAASVIRAQLVGLLPSQQIVAHADAPIRGKRLHVPLQTNPGCWSFHGGVWQQLEVGKVYRMDPTVEHGAVNWGAEVRLHLMIDVEDAD